MRPEVAEAVLKARRPNVLPPIESEGGIYIIALTGKREPSDPTKSTILDMEQVIARGEGSTAKLEALKTKAATCGDLTKSLEAVEGITRTPMKNVGITSDCAAVPRLARRRHSQPVDPDHRYARWREDGVLRVLDALGRC